ncbi:MAG: HIT family protein [Bacteroidales bacterium]|nr:HIT family protein [Bacteroidales bacterium]MBN2763822.1 HIT family protein [Bacteroidales bacterium]
MCPFCNPTILECVFLESQNFLAIYNIAPVLPGHALVIPRDHITSFIDLNRQQRAEFLDITTHAVRILLKAFNTDAFDMSVQEKPEAGQTIEHLHLHIVPRVKGDLPDPGDWYPLIHKSDQMVMDDKSLKRLSKKDLQIIVKKLRDVAASPELRE